MEKYVNYIASEGSVEEKIRVMESLWKDLCVTTASTQSLDWDQDVLSAREAAVAAGEM
jgi:hypothetical protein